MQLLCVCVCLCVCVKRGSWAQSFTARMRTRTRVSEGLSVHECAAQHACSSAQETDNGAAVALNVLRRRKLES